MTKDSVSGMNLLSLNSSELSNYRKNVISLRSESQQNQSSNFLEPETESLQSDRIKLLERIIKKKNKEILKLQESLRLSLEQNEFLDQELEELRQLCIEENQNTQNEINLREQDLQESFLDFEKNKSELGNIEDKLNQKQREIDRMNKTQSKLSDCISMTETDVEM